MDSWPERQKLIVLFCFARRDWPFLVDLHLDHALSALPFQQGLADATAITRALCFVFNTLTLSRGSHRNEPPCGGGGRCRVRTTLGALVRAGVATAAAFCVYFPRETDVRRRKRMRDRERPNLHFEHSTRRSCTIRCARDRARCCTVYTSTTTFAVTKSRFTVTKYCPNSALS